MASDKSIYELGLFETLPVGEGYIRRVPGGWVLTETREYPVWQGGDSHYETAMSSAFIPFDNGFMEPTK